MRGTGRVTCGAAAGLLVWLAFAMAPDAGAAAHENKAAAVAMAAQEGAAASAADLLKAAGAIKRESVGKKGDERRAILERAVSAYRRVVELHPADSKAASTALLRAGSILSTFRDYEKALECYRGVARYGAERENCARALLEIGHVLRRQKALDQAVASYEECARSYADVESPASQSLLWAGKIHRQMKRYEEARAAFRALVTEYSEPASRIVSAFDLLAQTYLDENLPEKAKAVLDEVEAKFRAARESSDDDDRRILESIRNMKTARALEKAGLVPKRPAPAPPAGGADDAGDGGVETEEDPVDDGDGRRR